jgi:hypothetical protein
MARRGQSGGDGSPSGRLGTGLCSAAGENGHLKPLAEGIRQMPEPGEGYVQDGIGFLVLCGRHDLQSCVTLVRALALHMDSAPQWSEPIPQLRTTPSALDAGVSAKGGLGVDDITFDWW